MSAMTSEALTEAWYVVPAGRGTPIDKATAGRRGPPALSEESDAASVAEAVARATALFVLPPPRINGAVFDNGKVGGNDP